MKTCTKCKAAKELVEFIKDKNRPDGRGSWCMSCHRPARKMSVERWRKSHLRTYLSSFFKERRERLEKLKSLPCLDCHNVFPSCVMDFDHRDPIAKVDSVALMAGRTIAWAKVLEEIAKCDLVCTNCHRLRTHRTRAVKRPAGAVFIEQLKLGKPCHDCGSVFEPCQMDFDHLYADKVSCVALMRNKSKKAILREVGKCDLVCANCHRIRTHNRPITARAS